MNLDIGMVGDLLCDNVYVVHGDLLAEHIANHDVRDTDIQS